MKKIIVLLLAVLMLFSLCACGGNSQKAGAWSIEQTVDEFGDVTEESVSVISGTFKGSFSNTATADSDLTVVVSFGKKALYDHYIAFFDLKEYGETNATYTSGDSKVFKMKIGEEVISDNLYGDAPNGTLMLGAQKYTWGADILFNELYKGNDVPCIINIGSSEYHFTLTANKFTSLCDVNNYKPGAQELTVKEAIKILLDDTGEYIGGAMDCFKDHFEDYEIMDTESIKENLNGNFLDISTAVWMPVDNYAFPWWYGVQYVASEGIERTFADYCASDNTGVKGNISKGIFLNGYKSYRPRYNYKNDILSETKITVENNLITNTIKDRDYVYQCRKITDDIFLLCFKQEDGAFAPSNLLISCGGLNDLLKIVDRANAAFEKIEG